MATNSTWKRKENIKLKIVGDIHPIFDRMIDRKAKERRLDQRGHVFWLTGLSGSGKSTLAIALERELFNQSKLVQLLDGDNIRTGISSNLNFSAADRKENIRRISEVARLFKDSGFIVICSFVSPLIAHRELARDIIGKDDFSLIYIKASLETCENRDVKGLYKKARKGEIKQFTGIDAPYEIPVKANLIVNTEECTLQESSNRVLDFIMKKI